MGYKVLTKKGEIEIGFRHKDTQFPTINKVDTGYSLQGNIRDGFEMVKNGKVYKADILKVDYKEKTFVVKVNGSRVSLQLKDRFDLILSQLGMTNMAAKKVNQLKSPMPGLVLDILVKDGMPVKQGEPLLILEAMKMENILKAPADVVIKSTKAVKGKAVEKNELLFEFE